MKRHYTFELHKMRNEGFVIAIDQRVTTGRLLTAIGTEQCATILSDRSTLAEYSEVALIEKPGGPSLFIATPKLISNPQLIVGFQYRLAALIGVNRALEANALLAGQSRSGKSVTLGLLSFQLSRLGYPIVAVGLKSFDASLAAALKAGTDSTTRLDENGNRTSAPFEYTTLQPGLKTKSFNYHIQKTGNQPKWIQASNLAQSFGQANGGGVDPTQRYFQTSALAMLQNIPHWGESWKELHKAADSLEQDRDAKYSTAGIRHDIALMGGIDQMNRIDQDSISVDLTRIYSQRGAFYFDAAYQYVGPIATAAAATVIQSAIATKAQYNPSRSFRVFLIVDEAQQIPRAQLKQMVEQCASLGICLIFAIHTLEQLGEDWPTIAMVQTRMIFSAVPGSLLDRHLQNIFGTEVKTVVTINFSESKNRSLATSVTTGPTGSSYGVTSSVGTGQNFGVGLSEKIENVWTVNDTLDLNDDPDRFVLQVSPGAELAQFGARPVVVQRRGHFMSFERINAIAAAVLGASPDTYLPNGTHEPKQLESDAMPKALAEKRSEWLEIFRKVAHQLQKERG